MAVKNHFVPELQMYLTHSLTDLNKICAKMFFVLRSRQQLWPFWDVAFEKGVKQYLKQANPIQNKSGVIYFFILLHWCNILF